MFLSDTLSNSSWSSLDRSDNTSRTWSVLWVNGLFVGMVAIVLSLRVFTKLFMAMRLFLDDYLMIGSALCFTIFCALNMYAAKLGFGNHLWHLPGLTDDVNDKYDSSNNLTLDDVAPAAAQVQKINYVALTMLAPAIILAKLSVVAILLRVFPPTMRALRLGLWGLAVVIVACCVSQALLIVFQCFPVQDSWALASTSGRQTCYVEPLDGVVMGLGVLNVVTDLVICGTPIPYFWKLKLPRPQKMCLCGLFLSGLIACGISIGRVLSLRGLHDDVDVTYATVPYFNWSCAEVGLIITTGSVPSLRPFLATILPDFFKEHNFTSILASSSSSSSEKRITMVSPSSLSSDRHKLEWSSASADGASWAHSTSAVGLTVSSSNRSTGATGQGGGGGIGTILITKEYQIEEVVKYGIP